MTNGTEITDQSANTSSIYTRFLFLFDRNYHHVLYMIYSTNAFDTLLILFCVSKTHTWIRPAQSAHYWTGLFPNAGSLQLCGLRTTRSLAHKAEEIFFRGVWKASYRLITELEFSTYSCDFPKYTMKRSCVDVIWFILFNMPFKLFKLWNRPFNKQVELPASILTTTAMHRACKHGALHLQGTSLKLQCVNLILRPWLAYIFTYLETSLTFLLWNKLPLVLRSICFLFRKIM